MPRIVEEILAHANGLATRFEQYEPRPEDELDMGAITALCAAAAEESVAEGLVIGAVHADRHAGTP